MFNIETINYMQDNSELVVFYNQTRSQSRNEINTHTEHLVQKDNDWKEAIWSLMKKKNKETRKKS